MMLNLNIRGKQEVEVYPIKEKFLVKILVPMLLYKQT